MHNQSCKTVSLRADQEMSKKMGEEKRKWTRGWNGWEDDMDELQIYRVGKVFCFSPDRHRLCEIRQDTIALCFRFLSSDRNKIPFPYAAEGCNSSKPRLVWEDSMGNVLRDLTVAPISKHFQDDSSSQSMYLFIYISTHNRVDFSFLKLWSSAFA